MLDCVLMLRPMRRSALARARWELGLRLEDIGARVGVDGATISRWERGIQRPDSEAVARLAEVLGLGVELIELEAATRRRVDVPTGLARCACTVVGAAGAVHAIPDCDICDGLGWVS